MNRLIRLQLRNVFHNKLFYVCLGLCLLLNTGIPFVASIIIKDLSPLMPVNEIVNMFNSTMSIMVVLFVVLFTCFDFSEGTTKNIIARGYSKVQLLFSKYIGSIVGVFSIYIVTSVVLLIMFSKNGITFDNIVLLKLLNGVIFTLTITIIYSTLAFILEKNSAAIIVSLFVPLFVNGILLLVDTKFKNNISKYWIDNVPTDFLKNPTIGNFGICILYCSIYIAIFLFLGIRFSKRKEIK